MPLGACSQSPPSACIPIVGPETTRAQNACFKTSTSVKREFAACQSAPATSAELRMQQEPRVHRIAQVNSRFSDVKACCTLGWWSLQGPRTSAFTVNKQA